MTKINLKSILLFCIIHFTFCITLNAQIYCQCGLYRYGCAPGNPFCIYFCNNFCSGGGGDDCNTLPTLTANGALTFCSGDSLTLTCSTAATYQWLNDTTPIIGANSSVLVVNTSGNYKCKVTKSGCGTATQTSVASIVAVETFPTVSLSASGSLSFCAGDSVILTANGTGYQYQWKKGGVNISGAKSKSYVAKTAGDYKCKVTNSCGTKTSGIRTVSIPCRLTNEHFVETLEHLSVYPNPATNSVTIKFPSDEDGTVQIVNLFGQIVFSEKINTEQTQIDLSKFKAGMYLVRWSSGENNEMKKISITK